MHTDRQTLCRKAFILKDVETVLSVAATGLELLMISRIIECFEKTHIILQRVAQVIAVTTGQENPYIIGETIHTNEEVRREKVNASKTKNKHLLVA